MDTRGWVGAYRDNFSMDIHYTSGPRLCTENTYIHSFVGHAGWLYSSHWVVFARPMHPGMQRASQSQYVVILYFIALFILNLPHTASPPVPYKPSFPSLPLSFSPLILLLHSSSFASSWVYRLLPPLFLHSLLPAAHVGSLVCAMFLLHDKISKIRQM